MWKPRLLVFALAVAEIDGDPKGFVDWFVKAKMRSNVTNLELTRMPTEEDVRVVPPRRKIL